MATTRLRGAAAAHRSGGGEAPLRGRNSTNAPKSASASSVRESTERPVSPAHREREDDHGKGHDRRSPREDSQAGQEPEGKGA